jgi:hypothetical protein
VRGVSEVCTKSVARLCEGCGGGVRRAYEDFDHLVFGACDHCGSWAKCVRRAQACVRHVYERCSAFTDLQLKQQLRPHLKIHLAPDSLVMISQLGNDFLPMKLHIRIRLARASKRHTRLPPSNVTRAWRAKLCMNGPLMGWDLNVV